MLPTTHIVKLFQKHMLYYSVIDLYGAVNFIFTKGDTSWKLYHQNVVGVDIYAGLLPE